MAPDGLPEIHQGDDLVALLGAALRGVQWPGGTTGVRDGDIVVVTSKVVSKAEGRQVEASDREQAITDETVRVVATVERDGVRTRIVENRLGLVMAAAGVDASNTPEGTVLLLPVDPDASARRLRDGLQTLMNCQLGMVVTDTVGRPWRVGLTDIAIGSAGVKVLDDLRGSTDSHGKAMQSTVTAVVDEIASAVELVTGKVSGRPLAVLRGLGHLVTDLDGPGVRHLQRPSDADLFRVGSAEAYEEGWKAGAGADAKRSVPD